MSEKPEDLKDVVKKMRNNTESQNLKTSATRRWRRSGIKIQKSRQSDGSGKQK